jgi:hypothetical protein
MKFSICFLEKDLQGTQSEYALGEIVIDDFHEIFRSSLSHWNTNKYLLQWREGLQRICNGHHKSCLIASMFNPTSANFIFLWTLYLDGDIVHVQNHLLFLDGLESPFLESEPYASVRDREIINDEGEKISEWDVNINTIKEYLASST